MFFVFVFHRFVCLWKNFKASEGREGKKTNDASDDRGMNRKCENRKMVDLPPRDRVISP